MTSAFLLCFFRKKLKTNRTITSRLSSERREEEEDFHGRKVSRSSALCRAFTIALRREKKRTKLVGGEESFAQTNLDEFKMFFCVRLEAADKSGEIRFKAEIRASCARDFDPN
jgi:hypothetical protein